MKTYKEKNGYFIFWRNKTNDNAHGFYNVSNQGIGYNYNHQYKGFNLKSHKK